MKRVLRAIGLGLLGLFLGAGFTLLGAWGSMHAEGISQADRARVFSNAFAEAIFNGAFSALVFVILGAVVGLTLPPFRRAPGPPEGGA